MKIQLSSTLPFTPLQLDSRQKDGRRAAGQLFGVDAGREYRLAVYEFRHDEQDNVSYLVDPDARVWLEEGAAIDEALPMIDAEADEQNSLVWIDHDESLTYKPYSFLIMNAMSRLVGSWDGVVYQTPSGERLRDTVMNATLQVVDACVCKRQGLWAQVSLAGDRAANDRAASAPFGWVPLPASAR